jgi:hypothetical protein
MSGLAGSNPTGSFGPNRAITDNETPRMLHRLSGSLGMTGAEFDRPLADVPSWVNEAVCSIAHDPDGTGSHRYLRRLVCADHTI